MSHLPSLFDTIGVDTMDLFAKIVIAGLEIVVAVILAALKDDDD